MGKQHKRVSCQPREKGGAYGGGAALNSSGVLSYYSYRDPNLEATLDAFERSAEWTAFTERDVEEAKLGVFQVWKKW